METPDFLKVAAQAPLCETFCVGGLPCEIRTNHESVLAAARESFPSVCRHTEFRVLHMTLWVDEHSHVNQRRLAPYVRGLDELVFAGFDEANSALVNLDHLTISGRFSRDVGNDAGAWKNTIFPVLMSIIGGSFGTIELHSACVARENQGLLLIGAGGSGKSTLSLALAESGFSFLSDDRTYCSLQDETLWAWAVPARAKLRPEAIGFFDGMQKRTSTSDESGVRFDPRQEFGFNHARKCRPRWLLFLDRVQGQQFELSKVDEVEAASLIEQDLMAEFAKDVALQEQTVEKLLRLPLARLTFGGRPQDVAKRILREFERVRLTM